MATTTSPSSNGADPFSHLDADTRALCESIVATSIERRSSWEPVDLESILAGDHVEPEPTTLRRGDGAALLYAGRLHQVSGEPEAGKGWFALTATAEVLANERLAVYVDFEDTAAAIVSRLRALGVPDGRIATQLTYLRPDVPVGDTAAQAALEAVLATRPALVVIDGVTEALTVHGLDLGDNADIARWLDLLPRPVARSGAAVMLIDHVVKDREARGRYALGAQHKLAGIDVAYALEAVTPFGRGRDGLTKVKVVKDRPGAVRQHADEAGRIADLALRSDLDSGSVTVDLRPPDGEERFRPTVLMERAWEAIEADPGVTTNALRQTVKGKNDWVQQAIELLVDEGYVERRRDGAANRFYTLRPFTGQAQLAPSPQARPDLAPANGSGFAPDPAGPLRGPRRGDPSDGDPDSTEGRPTALDPWIDTGGDG